MTLLTNGHGFCRSWRDHAIDMRMRSGRVTKGGPDEPLALSWTPVADSPSDPQRGRLRALLEWITGTPQGPASPPSSAGAQAQPGPLSRIGHYAIVRKLGEGG